MHLDDNSAENEPNISNLFAKHYFSSAYSHVNLLINSIKVCNPDCVDNISMSIAVEEIFSALANCSYNSFPDPDGIPYLILNKFRYALSLLIYFSMTGNHL